MIGIIYLLKAEQTQCILSKENLEQIKVYVNFGVCIPFIFVYINCTYSQTPLRVSHFVHCQYWRQIKGGGKLKHSFFFTCNISSIVLTDEFTP